MEKFSHLDGLNPQQKEGVQYGDGPLLLVAGAIGWAWPKGGHIIEEIAEDIIDSAL